MFKHVHNVDPSVKHIYITRTRTLYGYDIVHLMHFFLCILKFLFIYLFQQKMLIRNYRSGSLIIGSSKTGIAWFSVKINFPGKGIT